MTHALRQLAMALAVLALAACGGSPDQDSLTAEMKRRVAEEFQRDLLQLVRLDRQGSASATTAGGGSGRVVYFKTVLKLSRDFDFGGWDQPNAAALVALLGAGPRGIAGVKQGGNKAGDELRAFGSAEYSENGGKLALLPPRGFTLPATVAVPGVSAPPGAAETLLQAIQIALRSAPTDTTPTGRSIVEEELEAANLNIQARFARLRSGVALASGPASGEYWRIGEAVAQAKTSLPIRNLVTEGSVENLRLLRDRKVSTAIVQADVALSAVLGRDEFADDGPNATLRALAALYPEAVHIVVRADAPYRALSDLAAKRIGAGPDASGTRRNARDLLTAANAMQGTTLVAGDLRSLLAQLRAGSLDAVIQTIGAPANEMLAGFAATKLRLLPVPDYVVARISADSAYRRGTIPARTYADQADSVATVTVPALLVTDTRITDVEARNALELLFTIDFVRAGSAQGAMISRKTAEDVAGLPMHGGATTFYRSPAK